MKAQTASAAAVDPVFSREVGRGERDVSPRVWMGSQERVNAAGDRVVSKLLVTATSAGQTWRVLLASLLLFGEGSPFSQV